MGNSIQKPETSPSLSVDDTDAYNKKLLIGIIISSLVFVFLLFIIGMMVYLRKSSNVKDAYIYGNI